MPKRKKRLPRGYALAESLREFAKRGPRGGILGWWTSTGKRRGKKAKRMYVSRFGRVLK